MRYLPQPALRRFVLGFLVPALLVVSHNPALAQLPLGQWALITPGSNANKLVEAGNALFVGGENSLFRYDLGDGALRVLSKQDGLAGVSVNALAYDSATSQVVIGYRDANVDLLDPRTNTITNIPDIARRAIVGEKTIYAIATHAGQAFLSCSFGVVVIDLRRLEVVDSYVGLDNGENVALTSIAVSADSVVVTRRDGFGIYVGRRALNLLDFHNWTYLSADAQQRARSIARFHGHFYYSRDYYGLFRLGPAGAQQLPDVLGAEYFENSLTASRGRLTIAQPRDTAFTVLTASGDVSRVSTKGLGNIYQVRTAADGGFYLADASAGLVVLDAAGRVQAKLAPNGPTTDISFAVAPGVGADVYGFAGGYSSNTVGFGRRVGFAYRHDGRWQTFNRATVGANYPDTDINLSAAVWNPVNQKLYIASYGNGLLEWSGPDAPARRYDGRNSSLVNPLNSPDPAEARVPGVAVDAAGTVWVTNFSQKIGQPGLHAFNPAIAQWTPYLSGVDGAPLAERVVIDDNGYKWVTCFPYRATGTYAIVFNEATGAYRLLSASTTDGALLGPVYAIAKDRKGDIWLGTSKGVQVFYNTAIALSPGAYTASQPIIDRRPLLDNQTVRAIAVDGANRKWIGTTDGLYLFGEDGDEEIAHFTAENSPLPSDAVNTISINGTTGEVFVGTDNGLVSYRGSATEPSPEASPACTTVFPNPVPARFSGQIAFDGLPGGATVKITDVAGQLVYETKANGSRATWNARDYQGRRVRTGIYLAYASDPDGQHTCVSKVAVLGE